MAELLAETIATIMAIHFNNEISFQPGARITPPNKNGKANMEW
jgi:hypothetical protein